MQVNVYSYLYKTYSYIWVYIASYLTKTDGINLHFL